MANFLIFLFGGKPYLAGKKEVAPSWGCLKAAKQLLKIVKSTLVVLRMPYFC